MMWASQKARQEESKPVFLGLGECPAELPREVGHVSKCSVAEDMEGGQGCLAEQTPPEACDQGS